MTDPRPRPKYGEYAPLPPAAPEKPATAANDGGTAEAPASPAGQSLQGSSLNAQHQHDAAAGLLGAAHDTVVPERPRRMWDVMLTATLLLFGVVDVITTFSTVANLGPILREGLAAQGVDFSFTSDDLAIEAGGVANTIRIAVLVLTIVFALIQIQHKRIAFWIPVVGALIAGIAFIVAIFVSVLNDPGFMAYVESMQ